MEQKRKKLEVESTGKSFLGSLLTFFASLMFRAIVQGGREKKERKKKRRGKEENSWKETQKKEVGKMLSLILTVHTKPLLEVILIWEATVFSPSLFYFIFVH